MRALANAIAGGHTGGTLAATQGKHCRKGERFQAYESRINANATGAARSRGAGIFRVTDEAPDSCFDAFSAAATQSA
jgi:hypothetical protein